MNVLAFLVPVALLLGVVWVGVFMWTLKSGQYDDLEGEALRILDDEADEKPLGDGDAASADDATASTANRKPPADMPRQQD